MGRSSMDDLRFGIHSADLCLSGTEYLPTDNPEFAQPKRVGRPRAAVIKERIAIRLSRDVVEHLRASGDGRQTWVDAALREWLKTHSPA